MIMRNLVSLFVLGFFSYGAASSEIEEHIVAWTSVSDQFFVEKHTIQDVAQWLEMVAPGTRLIKLDPLPDDPIEPIKYMAEFVELGSTDGCRQSVSLFVETPISGVVNRYRVVPYLDCGTQ
jgi:hypothetical protein